MKSKQEEVFGSDNQNNSLYTGLRRPDIQITPIDGLQEYILKEAEIDDDFSLTEHLKAVDAAIMSQYMMKSSS